MPSFLYQEARDRFLRGQLDWTSPSTVVNLALVQDTYTPSDTHTNYTTEIATGSNVVATTEILSGARVSQGNGIADSTTDQNLVAVGGSGENIRFVVIYVTAGSPNNANLPIVLIELAANQATTGNDVDVIWPGAPNFIFKL